MGLRMKNFNALGVHWKIRLYLIQYDHNESCCGKDQCYQESAVAKNLICSFVNAGNNVMSANVKIKALQCAKGMKNTKVWVVETDSYKSVLQGITIPDIS